MNLLPIVERELRVTARRGITHWARFALTSVLALATVNSIANTGPSPEVVAKSVFTWLMTSAFVLACAACTLTADALSGESREGTLGLLFLTDLRSWDVTLGKLVSSGLGAVYVGLALVPVLMLPVLAGGVGGPEAARVGIALVAVILFALAAGLTASSREHARGRAVRRAGLWVAGTVLLPAMLGWFASSDAIAALSPMTTLRFAQDSEYRASPIMFWVSLTLQFLHTATLLWIAGSRLQQQFTQPVIQTRPLSPVEDGSAPIEEVYSVDPASNASYLAANPHLREELAPRRPAKDYRPLEWLITRQRGQRAACWIAAVLLLFPSFGLSSPLLRIGARGGLPLGFYSLFQLSWVADALLAWIACRFFVEARRSGELELLVTTPAGAQTLVSAHWTAMKRLLLWPAVLVITPRLLQGGCYFIELSPGPFTNSASYHLYLGLYALFRAFDLILLTLTTTWLGMLFGLTMRRLVSAVGVTLVLAAGMPMLLHTLVQLAIRPFSTSSFGSPGWLIAMFIQYGIAWAFLVTLVIWARRLLLRGPPAELLDVDWAKTAKDSAHRLLAGLRRLRWLTPGDQARTSP